MNGRAKTITNGLCLGLAMLGVAFPGTARAGHIFLTGHDPDDHAEFEGETGARGLFRKAIAYVRNGNTKPVLWVESRLPVPTGFVRGEISLTLVGVPHVWMDAAQLSSLDWTTLADDYSAIGVASDFGGTLSSAELDVLIAHKHDIAVFVNGGGGLFGSSESNYPRGYSLNPSKNFAFLPITVSSTSNAAPPYTLTSFGSSLGLISSNMQSSSHSHFVKDFGLNVIDKGVGGTAADQQIMTLAGDVTIYDPPVANAGPDQTVAENELVTLDGTGSYDTNTPLLPITYTWLQVSGPAVILANLTTTSPTFTTPIVPAAGAALVFRLTVSNGSLAPASDTVTVNVGNVNTPPVANAGADQSAGENTPVTLDSSLSSDLDGDPLTMHWTQVSGPGVLLDGTDTTSPTFTAPDVTAAQGTVDLKFQLVVNDGMVNSGPSTVIVHVKNTNDAPTADAGPNQSVNELDAVTLDGTLSSDPDNDSLTYSWTQLLGEPAVTLSGVNTATPSFQAPALDLGGLPGGTTLTFELTVNDGKVSSSSTVNVRVSNVNHAPLADAGNDQTVPSTTFVSLDGSNSADTDGDTLTYAWAQTGGPSVTLSGTDTAVSFTAPVAGPSGLVLKFQLTVNDGYGGVASDEVAVKVTYVNHPTTASAGAPQTVNEGDTALLAGIASDPDGNDLGIAWTQMSGPIVTLANSTGLSPSFAAPLVTRAEADVVLRLAVDDGYGGSASSDVTIHIANINHPPTADAPSNMSVPESTPVSLIGQGTDPDTEEQSQLVYAWQQIGGPGVTLSGTGANIGFTAPLVTAGGDPNAKETLAFRLTVTDPNGASASDDVTVVVTNVEHAPTAAAGGSLTANEAASVTLNGSASSDPDGDALSYAWVQTAGPTVTLSDANTAYPYFTAPFVNATGATLKFKLTVNDGFSATSSDTANVTVANINDVPTVTNAQPSSGTLWPPDHSMVKVSITGVVDPNNNATVKITGVTQDEATNGLGDGDTAIDAVISADGTSVLVRAERSGKGNGRVYHIHFTASDFEGSASGVVKVSVPRDKKGDAATDGGELFDSTH